MGKSKISFTDAINKIALAFIFLDNLYLATPLSVDFRLQYLIFGLFIFVSLFNRIQLKIKLGIFLKFLFAVVSLLGFSLIVSSSVGLVLKQAVLIIFNLIFGFILVRSYDNNFIKIFKDYLGIISLAAFVGYIQLFSQIVGFRYGADFSYLGFYMQNFNLAVIAIQSWFQEPSFLVFAFIPAVFVSIYSLIVDPIFLSKRKAVFLILIFLLSNSFLGYITFGFSLAIIIFSRFSFVKYPVQMLFGLVLIIIFSVSAYQIPAVQLRVNHTFSVFTTDNVSSKDIDRLNLSSYAIYSNYRITKEVIKNKPLFGVGLGNYEMAYDSYLDRVIPDSYFKENYQLNKKDANSLLLRTVSELGLFGLILFTLFLIRGRRSYSNAYGNSINLWLINNSIFVLILVRLIRNGHYSHLGFLFFLIVYLGTSYTPLFKKVNDNASI